ncbi:MULTISPECIES: response regulator [Halomonadaceae]|uniref:Response regulator n=2 Tax=Vreelandella TaxID=3137766 RepID=A0A7Z0RYV9_9GAMM|nr:MULTISPECIES: response regulator [Halomonas]AJY49248.1 response regulator receiver protein [Halomonas sp. KO116]NYS78615.1 response regulator [Halomonas glaciei]|tara:strand:+ start:4670 stop:5026 length:357 start_codon:yes stop_codon:yes gene_type:complete
MHILVVDDDPLAGEMTAALLESQGHEPLLANDAMEAVEQLDAHSDIKLIVSDMHMPLVSGLALLAMLREQDNHLPFILLTGDIPDAALRQTPGLDACLCKDAELACNLEAAVKQALDS